MAFSESWSNAKCLVVGALRSEGKPLLLNARTSRTRSAVEIADHVQSMCLEFEALDVPKSAP
eukprot:2294355-Amphidinium_carterae.1